MPTLMKLYLLQLAMKPDNGVPVPGYVIQTAHENILVDTGLPKRFITNASAMQSDPFGWVMRDEDYVVNRLVGIGLTPQDIRYVVCTHLDPDHAGNHDAFPEAEFIIQRTHYTFAKTSGLQRFDVARAHWDNPNLRYRLIDGDTELVPSVELIESSGHVPGHQSVLVRLPKTGPVLLAIDAITRSTMTDADTRHVASYDLSEADTRASTRKLMALAAREGVKLIVFGHDGQQWARLKKAPEGYD
jgi:N-acyl homoserine lactone hydrolase